MGVRLIVPSANALVFLSRKLLIINKNIHLYAVRQAYINLLTIQRQQILVIILHVVHPLGYFVGVDLLVG